MPSHKHDPHVDCQAQAFNVCRWLLSGKIVALICDLGVLACTFVKLYSDMATARGREDASELSNLREEITFTFLSCAMSVLSFGASSVGVHKLCTHICSVVRRSSAAVRGMRARACQRHVCSQDCGLSNTFARCCKDCDETNPSRPSMLFTACMSGFMPCRLSLAAVHTLASCCTSV